MPQSISGTKECVQNAGIGSCWRPKSRPRRTSKPTTRPRSWRPHLPHQAATLVILPLAAAEEVDGYLDKAPNAYTHSRLKMIFSSDNGLVNTKGKGRSINVTELIYQGCIDLYHQMKFCTSARSNVHQIFHNPLHFAITVPLHSTKALFESGLDLG